MDSRYLAPMAIAGWLLLTLGVWGACGRPWWLWPASVGVALLALAASYGWAMTVHLRAAARKPEIPVEVRT